jgi:hypothetical protein
MKPIVCLICLVYISSFISSCSAISSAETGSMDDSAITWRTIPVPINESFSNLEVVPQVSSSNISSEKASISGTTFNDLNANGFKEESEPGLFNWTIVLMGDGENFQELNTNVDGFYSFEGLKPGNYTLKEELMDGWNQTSPPEGSYDINFVYGEGFNYSFGNIQGQALTTSESVSHPLISRSEWIRMVNEIEEAPNFTTKSELPSNLSYPSSISLLGYIPSYSERQQGTCGNCWAWACTGVAEVAHTLSSSKDRLSIQYLNSNFDGGSGRWACCGGNILDFLQFYNSKGKFIPWNNLNAYYRDDINHCCVSCPASVCSLTSCCSQTGCGGVGHSSVLASNIIEYPNYPIETVPSYSYLYHGITQDQAINTIKSVLTQNKAIVFSFYLPSAAAWSSFNNIFNTGGIWDPAPYCGKPILDGNGGHSVLCIGYDDASDTWIMLNSWGPGGRSDGTFRVKMHMNYDCSNEGEYSYFFQWFDVNFVNVAPPTVTTDGGVSGIGQTVATLGAQITNTGGVNPELHIVWGTSDFGTNSGSWPNNYNMGTKGVGTYYHDASPLNSGTRYYYRCYATNSAGTGWTGVVQFDTPASISKPTVANGIDWSLVTANSARLNGEIANTGGENPTVHICWGTTNGATTQTNWQNDVSLGALGTGAFYKDISGLNPGTQYYYRCYATNSAGTSWSGQTVTFSTLNGGQATLISPTGTITSTQPTYKWNPVSGSTWYYLWIDGPSGKIFDKWYTSSEVTSGSVCQITPAVTLTSGSSYKWWIQTWNNAGYGPWSDELQFTISGVNQAPTVPSIQSGSTMHEKSDYARAKIVRKIQEQRNSANEARAEAIQRSMEVMDYAESPRTE